MKHDVLEWVNMLTQFCVPLESQSKRRRRSRRCLNFQFDSIRRKKIGTKRSFIESLFLFFSLMVKIEAPCIFLDNFLNREMKYQYIFLIFQTVGGQNIHNFYLNLYCTLVTTLETHIEN